MYRVLCSVCIIMVYGVFASVKLQRKKNADMDAWKKKKKHEKGKWNVKELRKVIKNVFENVGNKLYANSKYGTKILKNQKGLIKQKKKNDVKIYDICIQISGWG